MLQHGFFHITDVWYLQSRVCKGDHFDLDFSKLRTAGSHPLGMVRDGARVCSDRTWLVVRCTVSGRDGGRTTATINELA